MTLELHTSVGALVAERPSRSRVLEKLGIDYCCGGKLPLEEACRKRGLAPAAVVAQLLEADQTPHPGEVDAAAMGLAELADHIEQTHHAWLREELPRLDGMTKKVSAVHGEAEPRLREVREVFLALSDELLSHMQKEEQILFPAIRGLERGEPVRMGSVASPIAQMEHEHDQAGGALAAIRAATDNFVPPMWACGTYRAMLAGLADLEADMHRHIHKENNVLFPRALRLEERAGS